ncbi:MAG: hypothetical protein K2X11_19125 [Acetobacteraceae bacterium]|nr:hypothetical protein [Acetobacteraceae bacterium]
MTRIALAAAAVLFALSAAATPAAAQRRSITTGMVLCGGSIQIQTLAVERSFQGRTAVMTYYVIIRNTTDNFRFFSLWFDYPKASERLNGQRLNLTAGQTRRFDLGVERLPNGDWQNALTASLMPQHTTFSC